jgi:hypothetical protein
VFIFASSLHAIVYIVPSDRDLVRRADAIVIATAIESHAELTARDRVITASELAIDDVLKGNVSAGDTIRLVEPGGIMSERATLFPGSPSFEVGKRYLLFLRANDDEWTIYGLQLGQFEFTTDLLGRELITRIGSESIFGLDETDGSLYTDHYRNAAEFLAFIRTTSQGGAAPAREDYFVDKSDVLLGTFPEFWARATLVPVSNFTRQSYLTFNNARWENGGSAPFGYCCPGGYPTMIGSNPIDAPGAASTAVNNWNVAGTSIHYTMGGETPGKTGGFTPDFANTILFNDPNNFLPGCCAGAVAVGGITTPTNSYMLDGLQYNNMSEVDVIVEKNSLIPTFVNQGLLTALLTHEVGHTLGFRHSDGTADSNSPPPNCNPSTDDCAGPGAAVMAHIVQAPALNLQTWDLNAAQTVYGSGPTCTNPSITVQPQSQTIAFGAQANLSVTAGGTGPLSYQWYVGTSPDASNSVPGATSVFFNPSPTTTTNYWVRVSNSCTPPAPVNSQTATVTVQPCQPPAITAQPLDQSVTSGNSAFLSVSFIGSNPVTVTWYRGTAPDMSGGSIGTGPGVTTPPLTSTSMFWARLQNSCGQQDTRTVTITVAPCAPPVINDDPPDQTVAPGASANLFVGYTGTAGTVTWFRGTFPDSSSFAGSGQFFMTPALSSTTSFWAQITNSCGSANSRTVIVTVSFGCTSPTITTNPANQTVVNGTSVTLAVVASGTGPLHYAWFQGPMGNETKPVGTDSPSFKSAALTTATQFWVKVTNSCGLANSTAATVNLKPGRPRSVKHR